MAQFIRTKLLALKPYTSRADECYNCKANNLHRDAEKTCDRCKLNLCRTCFEDHEDHDGITKGSDEYNESNQQTISCGQCKNKGFVAAFCSECKIELCNNCKHRHKTDEKTRHHKVFGEAVSPGNEPTQLQSRSASTFDVDEKKRPKFTLIKATQADSVTIQWEKPDLFRKGDCYQISYREDGGDWRLWREDIQAKFAVINGLKGKTRYIFRVRVVRKGVEWPYSKESAKVQTPESHAASLVQTSRRTKQGKPSIYSLPAEEKWSARNEIAKTKKYKLHRNDSQHNTFYKQKTIMLVGATGTGKTTLVDGFVNYVLGVNWTDPFRFSIVELEKDEKTKRFDQTVSQTEWVTCYELHWQKGGRLNYPLYIIDTPGFGDTRGISQDKQIIEQIRHLFSEKGEKGVLSIDAICFVNKAPDARLTPQQKYVYESILAIFGKDVKSNICSLITFADGNEPQVLHSLQATNLPFEKYFCFNNSALFAPNEPSTNATQNQTKLLSPMFWDMGVDSFRHFFEHLEKLPPKSLEMTKTVLNERKRLENVIENIQKQLKAGRFTINSLEREIDVLTQHKTDAEANKDFVYEIRNTVVKTKPLPKGQHITNCLQCQHTCHEVCYIPLDEDKAKCWAMDGGGNCRICPQKCIWSQHKNTPHIIYTEIVTKKETCFKKLEKYQKAIRGVVTHEQLVDMLKVQVLGQREDVQKKMAIVKDCNESLKQIALRPNPLSMVEFIDLWIEAEKREKDKGYHERIEELWNYREKATTDAKAKEYFKRSLIVETPM